MNKRLALFTALLVAVSCTSNSISSPATEQLGTYKTVSVYTPSAQDSRVAIDPSGDNNSWLLSWEDGDQVGICADGVIDKFTIGVSDQSSSSAQFNGYTSAATARVVYPYVADALSNETYTVDLAAQSYDFNDHYGYLGECSPLISSEMIDMTADAPSAYMQHISAAVELRLKFSDLEEGASYKMSSVTLNGVPSSTSFLLDANVDQISSADADGEDIVITIENSPAVEADEIYTILASTLPFSVASDESISFTLTFEKTTASGSTSSISRSYTNTNTSGEEVLFERATHNYISKICAIEDLEVTYSTLTIDDTVITGSYVYEDTAKSVGDVDLTIFYVGNYSYYSNPPLQFKASAGYMYNNTPLIGLKDATFTINTDKGYDFTLYVGTAKKPLTTTVTGAVDKTNATITYEIPEGYSYFTVYNKSSSAAYAYTMEFSYVSLGEATEDDSDTESVSVDEPYSSDNTPLWGEIPAYVEDDNYIYVTHTAELANGDEVRNFSLCFDKESRAAAWVAYPYHECYNGDAERSEKWGYDPKIDASLQANLSGSYADYDGQSYDRGHQMASADRLTSYSMNMQTFYYSNMTPQNSSLNQGKWGSLEADVRAQVCSDTLYVVTGADFSQNIGYALDKSDNPCAIPHAYFKVLLRTREGDTGKAISECSADELQAIGYWVENIYYTVFPDPVSVSYIEEMTGFDFFPTVPDSVKDQCDVSLWVDL